MSVLAPHLLVLSASSGAGHRPLEGTGLNGGGLCLRARFFDPVTAQFLSVDPWVTSTHMPYAYTVGNPFQHTDPLGLAPEDINHWEQAAKAAAAPVIAAWNIVTSLAALTTTAGQIQFLAKGWCDYQSNGGGWGGAWASANINLNPMYAAIHSGTNAYDAYTQGRYGDGAIHASEAILITGLTGLGARTPLALKPKPGNSSVSTAGAAKTAEAAVMPKITFGHEARHLEGTGLSAQLVESAIQQRVGTTATQSTRTTSFWGRIEIEGTIIEYRAYTLPDGTINVGTYYVP